MPEPQFDSPQRAEAFPELPFPVPESLDPTYAESMFPVINSETISELRQNKWAGLGVVCLVMTGNGQVVVLDHNESSKIKGGSLGFMSEMTKQYPSEKDGTMVPEQIPETLSRAFYEELGLTQKVTEHFRVFAPMTGAWRLMAVPLHEAEEQQALGIVTVLFLDDDSTQLLKTYKRETKEIRAVAFRTLKEIENGLADPQKAREWRQRAHGALEAAEPLLVPYSEGGIQRMPLFLPRFDPERFGEDLHFTDASHQ